MIANIASDDGLILPHSANPTGSNFRERHVVLTLDYQFMVNPAHNADRGPISIFSGRLHGEF